MVLYTYPGSRVCPLLLGDLLNWVHEYFIVANSDPIEITRKETPLSYMPPPEPAQPSASFEARALLFQARRVAEVASCSANRAVTHTVTCACKKCGTVTTTQKEKPVVDQATCLHASTERSGSSKKNSRLKCKLAACC